MDAVGRAKEMVERGATTEEILGALRDDGCSIVGAMSALRLGVGMNAEDARQVVLESPLWADQRASFFIRKWIDPPDPPDEETLERLRAVCREDSRIVELWVAGSRMTRADGSSSESTDLVLILDPPFDQSSSEEQSRVNLEVSAALEAVAPTAGRRRSWVFADSSDILTSHLQHCMEVYVRPEDQRP